MYHIIHMHRTTILLDDGLIKGLKRKAAQEGKNVTDLVKIYVRRGLQEDRPSRSPDVVKLPSFSMGIPTIDPADRSLLWDLMDQDERSC